VANPEVTRTMGGTLSRAPAVEGLEGLLPGAEGDAVWIGRLRGDGTLIRVIVLDDPRLSDDAEAQLLAQQAGLQNVGRHPLSVAMLGLQRLASGHLVLLTEHHSLGTLDRVLSTGTAPWPEVAAIGLQLATALDYAHRAGVCHGRINPGSIHLSEQQSALLGGFAAIGQIEESLELAPSCLPFVAPEGGQDASADVYSLGATLFAAGTGRTPGARPSWALVAPAMRPVLQAAMGPIPRNRPTAAELVGILSPLAPDIADHLRAAPVVAAPKPAKKPSKRRPASAAAGAAKARSTRKPRVRPVTAKRPKKAYLAGALVILAAVGAGVLSHLHANDPVGVPTTPVSQPARVESPSTTAAPLPDTTDSGSTTAGQITPIVPQPAAVASPAESNAR